MSASGAKEANDTPGLRDDPFSKHLQFVERFDRRHRVTSSVTGTIEPIKPLDTLVDKWPTGSMVDGLLNFQGAVRAPRIKTAQELDDETEEAMAHREPQFHLRNIGRAERYADPDAPLELERKTHEYGLERLSDEVKRFHKHEPPALLEELTVDFVAANLSYMRWQRDAMKWEEYFCRELKDTATGPLWRRAPTAGGHERGSEIEASLPSDDEAR